MSEDKDPIQETEEIQSPEEETETTAEAPEEEVTEKTPEDLLEEATTKVDELKDKYLRLFAEFDNYKKRVAKERLALIKEAGKDVIVDLLPVLDDFDRALKAAEESDQVAAVKEGMELIHNKIYKNLEQKGLKSMESLNADFDAEYHEALTEIPAPSEELKGKVLDVVEKGYYLNEKIIRYAKVVVGK